MKTITKLTIKLILLLFTFIQIGCNSSNNYVTKNTIVLVKYKAQPDKGVEAVAELTKLIEKVKQEPHFVHIRLHVDPNEQSNILLYEEWDDLSYYNSEHMNTAHLQDFIEDSRNFLAGPPEITMWKVESIFE